jgi:hypothetical protein
MGSKQDCVHPPHDGQEGFAGDSQRDLVLGDIAVAIMSGF